MPRKTAIAVTAAVLLSLPHTALAGGEPFGLGVLLGEPSGISMKVWLGPATALDGGLAWSALGDDRLHLQADFVWHDYGLFDVDRGHLPVYYGVGGRALMRDGRDRLGIRFPVGVAYEFEGGRFDAFMEAAPILDLVPLTDVELAAGLGVRYYFR